MAEALDRVNAIDSRDHGAADSLETIGKRLPKIGVIFNEEDAALARHGVTVCCAAFGCHRKGCVIWVYVDQAGA
jgi:hypothetical protein